MCVTTFKVTLPSGTEVSFSFNSWSHWIDYIQIVASSTDLQNTEGICGYYDYDRSNDFIPKNENTHTSDEKRFALSWRWVGWSTMCGQLLYKYM